MTRAPLVLLTASFPYEVGEEFLEDELPYLAKRFERVVIVPLSAAGEPTRKVPANVHVEPGLPRWLSAPTWQKPLPPPPAASARALLRDLSEELPVSAHPRALLRAVRYLERANRIRQWLARTLDLTSPCLFYAYWLGPAALAACWLKAEHPGVQVVARAHGADLYRERHTPSYIPLQRSLVSSLDRVYAISQHGLDYLMQLAPAAHDHLRLSRLGAAEPAAGSRASLDGVLRVVSCSNTASVKRLPLLVSGLAAFASRAPAQRIHWCHLGGGPDHAQLVQLAASQLGAAVEHELPGHALHEDIAVYYASHAVDAFINVSASEGLPVSIMEAQSFGIPVIATAVGGTPELVSAQNGWLLPQDPTPDQIAAALLELQAASPETLARKRESARSRWRALAHAPDNYTRFASELERMMEPHAGH